MRIIIYTLLAILAFVVLITELWHYDPAEPEIGDSYSSGYTNVIKRMAPLEDEGY